MIFIKAVIIGAGPAGLTAAYELLKRKPDSEIVILEESQSIGGISRTVRYKNNRMDLGGHRFFSKIDRVNKMWEELMPLQGSLSYDDKKLGRYHEMTPGGLDPEKDDRVMLKRTRVSRIYYDRKFFDYPISAKVFSQMGPAMMIRAGFSYLLSMFRKLPEDNLENFYINRFGRVLYSMFFEGYTEKLWGRHPSQISADWGAQRVKGLSVLAVAKDMLGKIFNQKSGKVETSLIGEFEYPKYGPGQLWEVCAQEIEKMGGKIRLGSSVRRIITKDGRITAVEYDNEGKTYIEDGDIFFSSMPVKDLVGGMNAPDDVSRIADGLPYRDFVTIGMKIDKLALKNKTKIRTLNNIVPDCWIYVQDTGMKMGRIQIFNNWSPYLVGDPEKYAWVGLEFFCKEGDKFWTMDERKFALLAADELVRMGVIRSKKNIRDYHIERVKKAYPAYFDTYSEIDTVIDYLNGFDNLYCIGRNGQHRYNNMDHSMMTAFESVDNILSGRTNKDNIWNVNTEQEYHETKSSQA